MLNNKKYNNKNKRKDNRLNYIAYEQEQVCYKNKYIN